jgi:hypothetical protein
MLAQTFQPVDGRGAEQERHPGEVLEAHHYNIIRVRTSALGNT